MNTLKRPPLNMLDNRQERDICSDGVAPCKCGTMPTGVEYVTDVLDADGKPDKIGACVIIQCSNGCRKIMTETPESAVALWSNAAMSDCAGGKLKS